MDRSAHQHIPRAAGFSVIELIVALAILTMLAGVVTPAVGAMLDGSRIERAERDVEAIASALRICKDSLGLWPTMDAYGNPGGTAYLLSGTQLPAADVWSDSAAWWARISASRDLLQNHLSFNRPGGQTLHRYATSGAMKWRGPYLETLPLDPWQRPYVVNIGSSASTSETQDQRVWVISAGPDGKFQTSVDAARTDAELGDDIAALVLQR